MVLPDRSVLCLVHHLKSQISVPSSAIKSNSKETRNFSKGSPIIHTAVTNLLAGGRVFDSRTVEIPICAPESPDWFSTSHLSKVWWFSYLVYRAHGLRTWTFTCRAEVDSAQRQIYLRILTLWRRNFLLNLSTSCI
jgi:hypothetical protein